MLAGAFVKLYPTESSNETNVRIKLGESFGDSNQENENPRTIFDFHETTQTNFKNAPKNATRTHLGFCNHSEQLLTNSKHLLFSFHSYVTLISLLTIAASKTAYPTRITRVSCNEKREENASNDSLLLLLLSGAVCDNRRWMAQMNF